jgi:hypothetical protein
MDGPATQRWFLRKHEDGGVFGPLSFDQLSRWASAAQISPHDTLSTDQQTWFKAPMLPQLGMDWLVEITSEQYYGPTTLGTVQEFIRLGEINEQTFVINSCDGTRRQIQELPALFRTAREETSMIANDETASLPQPPASGMSIDLQDRIRDLEQSLREERRAYQELERKYQDLVQQHGLRDL